MYRLEAENAEERKEYELFATRRYKGHFDIKPPSHGRVTIIPFKL